MEDIRLSIIGAGKVGSAIALLAHRAGVNVTAIANRTHSHAETARDRLGGEVVATDMASAAASSNVILIAVSDDAIVNVCDELVSTSALNSQSTLIHCSGALGSDLIARAAHDAKCYVASLHPLQTFPTVESAISVLPDSYWFYEGDKQATDVIRRLALTMNINASQISAEAKALYHIGAVVACNYLTALMDLALSAEVSAGIQRDLAWNALLPLIQSTLSNIDELGCEAALTGPIARGDAKTVERHLQALSPDSPLYQCYKTLGMHTVDLAVRKGSIPDENAKKCRELLKFAIPKN